MNLLCRIENRITMILLAQQINYFPMMVPLLGVLVPFVIRWIDNLNKHKKARQLIDLVKTRDELSELLLLKREAGGPQNALLIRRMEVMLFDLDKQIRTTGRQYKIQPYILLIAVEIIFFISGMYFGILVWMDKIISGKSHENNVPFLEGIFGSPGARISLLLIYVTFSVYWVIKREVKIQKKYGRKWVFNLVMLAFFNLTFVAVTLLFSLLLSLLDFINPWF